MTQQLPISGTDPNALLDESVAAGFLSISPRTLRNWRTRGNGPKFVKISARCIRYRMRDLLAWSDKRTRRSTSDLGIFT
ncbi:helix-turn-helix transcriptional regulator [Maricaulis sp.]|uniref:helix-turn-helix transcriptional regulator n=1 Tax=Maricaulis sp. TaxID=1486257 RepID=UPI003A90095F